MLPGKYYPHRVEIRLLLHILNFFPNVFDIVRSYDENPVILYLLYLKPPKKLYFKLIYIKKIRVFPQANKIKEFYHHFQCLHNCSAGTDHGILRSF